MFVFLEKLNDTLLLFAVLIFRKVKYYFIIIYYINIRKS